MLFNIKNRKVFLILTFIIIIVIINFASTLSDAVLYITILTNFMILSEYIRINIAGKEDEKVNITIDKDVINSVANNGSVSKKVDGEASAQVNINNFSTNDDMLDAPVSNFSSRSPTTNLIDSKINGDGKDKERFTGFYTGGAPQFGLGSGAEIQPRKKHFQLESLADKMEVMSDDKIDHTPELPPLGPYPDKYMDVDDKNAFFVQARQRDRRAIDGRILANSKHFAKYYEDELDDEEKKIWWGNRDYERTKTFGEMTYQRN